MARGPVDEGEVLPGPLPATPLRRPSSVRRTSHLDITRRAGALSAAMVTAIQGEARDVVTDHVGGAVAVGSASLAVRFGEDGTIAAIEQAPAAPSCDALLGTTVGFGSRGAVLDLLRELTGTPLGLLVDDLSGAPAPAGYGALRERMVLGLPDPIVMGTVASRARDQTDVCAGWRSGGRPTAHRAAGRPLPLEPAPPVAPTPGRADDLFAWHDHGRLGARQARRMRRLDVWREADVVRVDAWFRDTAVDPDPALTERVVHEYCAWAVLDAATLTVQDVVAEPRSLPFPTDCPAAAGSAASIVGLRAAELRARVTQVSRGPGSCTHLNDLFRSLGDVPHLLGQLER